jgi:hypothetical protein
MSNIRAVLKGFAPSNAILFFEANATLFFEGENRPRE